MHSAGRSVHRPRFSAICVASPSHDVRSRLHWCINNTPGPGFPAEKYETLIFTPSAAARSVSCFFTSALAHAAHTSTAQISPASFIDFRIVPSQCRFATRHAYSDGRSSHEIVATLSREG
jgi:hypothetical protein